MGWLTGKKENQSIGPRGASEQLSDQTKHGKAIYCRRIARRGWEKMFTLLHTCL
jgi:hypothetical protein